MSQGAPPISRALLRSIFKGEPFHDPKGRAMQQIPPDRPKIAEPEEDVIPAYSEEDRERGKYVVDDKRLAELALEGRRLFPTETVLYKSDGRDYDVSYPYDKSLTIKPPVFRLAITFQVSSDPSTEIPPIILHRGRDRTGPIYGKVEALERHTVATINNHAFNPTAPFPTTRVEIDAHITRQYSNYSFTMPSTAAGGDPSVQLPQRFQWLQCESHPEVLDLARTRPEGCEAHDWCWVDRKNERGMKLFYISPAAPGYAAAAVEEETKKKKRGFFGSGKEKKDVKLKKKEVGKCLAVYVAGKVHSKMNPMKVGARIRWFEEAWEEGGVDGPWGEEGKVAAFLALLAYGEKTYVIDPFPMYSIVC